MFTTSNVVILSHRLAFLVVFKGSHNRKYKMYGSGWNKYLNVNVKLFFSAVWCISSCISSKRLSESVVNLNHVLQCGHQIYMFSVFRL